MTLGEFKRGKRQPARDPEDDQYIGCRVVAGNRLAIITTDDSGKETQVIELSEYNAWALMGMLAAVVLHVTFPRTRQWDIKIWPPRPGKDSFKLTIGGVTPA